MENAYYKRWILVSFNLRKNCYFCKKPIVKDPDLLEKLTTDEELSGLLNLALISARRLLAKRRFVKSPTTEEIREDTRDCLTQLRHGLTTDVYRACNMRLISNLL